MSADTSRRNMAAYLLRDALRELKLGGAHVSQCARQPSGQMFGCVFVGLTAEQINECDQFFRQMAERNRAKPEEVTANG